jgi:hypothetical protein
MQNSSAVTVARKYETIITMDPRSSGVRWCNGGSLSDILCVYHRGGVSRSRSWPLPQATIAKAARVGIAGDGDCGGGDRREEE